MHQQLFELPDEVAISGVISQFPCREAQIRALATLISPNAAPCPNLIVYGTEATGKSAVTSALLSRLADVAISPPSPSPSRPQSSSPSPLPAVLNFAVVSCGECVTVRQLLERVAAAVAVESGWIGAARAAGRRCDSVAQLAADLARILLYSPRPDGSRFVLVLDGIDRQREAGPMLLPALARLAEIIPSLTTVFITTHPPPALLRIALVPHVHFPPYRRGDLVTIVSSPALGAFYPPRQPELPGHQYLFPSAGAADDDESHPSATATAPTTTTSDPDPASTSSTPAGKAAEAAAELRLLWQRFAAVVYDTLNRPADRSLPGFRAALDRLWPRFVAPVARGDVRARDFSRLLVAGRAILADEATLVGGVLRRPKAPAVVAAAGGGGGGVGMAGLPGSAPATPSRSAAAATTAGTPRSGRSPFGGAPPTPTGVGAAVPMSGGATDLTSLLPSTARLLLVAAYLASHNPARTDYALFSTRHDMRRKRRAAGVKRGGRRPAKARKIARKLLGARAFVLERMAAVFAAVRREAVDNGAPGVAGGGKEEAARQRVASAAGTDGDVAMALATLTSLRLLVRVGGAGAGVGGQGAGTGADVLDRGGRWRVNVGWEVVRGVGRSVGVEVEDWLVEG